MTFLEHVVLLALLAAAREAVMSAAVHGEPAPEGYFYVWGYAVCGTDRSWLPGLWEKR